MNKLSPILSSYLKQSPLLPNLESVSVTALREQFNNRQKVFNENALKYDLNIQDGFVELSREILPIRIYRKNSEEILPTLIFFHGGGFVFGNLDTLECHCREIAHFAKCMVISVDYPLAPESTFPAAPEALYEATNYIYSHLDNWKGDKNSIFVGGSSSGANLAAVVAIMIRDRGGASLKGQILLCPMTDTNFKTASYLENAVGYNLTRDHCKWFFSQYTSQQKLLENPLVAPLKNNNLGNLPSALIVTAEFDPLRDEGRAYAKSLLKAGVECMDCFYPGMIHGFSTLPIDLPEKTSVLNKINIFIHK